MPLSSLLEHFAEEIHEHISQKKCPYGRNSRKNGMME
jgi:hypothetical protein